MDSIYFFHLIFPWQPLKTPTKSPTGGHFQSLPNLDDAALRSPVGIFLSPHPPTPLSRTLDESTSFDKHDELKETTRARKSAGSDKELADSKPSVRSPKTPRSPRTPKRETDRERFVTTPTDFAMDYGKHPNSASFDTSNGTWSKNRYFIVLRKQHFPFVLKCI